MPGPQRGLGLVKYLETRRLGFAYGFALGRSSSLQSGESTSRQHRLRTPVRLCGSDSLAVACLPQLL
jgi:hypothetical protein